MRRTQQTRSAVGPHPHRPPPPPRPSVLSAVETWSDAPGRARLAYLLLTAQTEELLALYAGLLERAMGSTGLTFVASADVERLANVLFPMEGDASRVTWVAAVQRRCDGGLSFGAVLDAAVALVRISGRALAVAGRHSAAPSHRAAARSRHWSWRTHGCHATQASCGVRPGAKGRG